MDKVMLAFYIESNFLHQIWHNVLLETPVLKLGSIINLKQNELIIGK
jgi:hypothetical protein